MTTEKGATGKRRRIALLSIAILLLILGFATLFAGAAIAILNQTATDPQGYALSQPYNVRTSTYAFMLTAWPDSDPSDSALAKWVVTSANPNKALFVGWGYAEDTNKYLEGVQFEGPFPGWNWEYAWYSSSFTVNGTKTWNSAPPSALPSQENFWIDSSQTSSNATINWDIQWNNATTGDRALLIMNADGTSNVQADIQFGTKIPSLSWVPFILIPLGVVMCLVGLVLIRRKIRRPVPKNGP